MNEREAGRKLGGVVQLDDAYLGGERNGGKAGRGSENKRPFVIAVETTQDGRPRQAVIDPVPGFTRTALTQWIGQRLRPGADVYSRWVNVVLSNLKRSLDGAYHAFKFTKYAQRYLAETQWRFNRRFDLTALVPRPPVAAAQINPWSERRLRDVPVFSAEVAC